MWAHTNYVYAWEGQNHKVFVLTVEDTLAGRWNPESANFEYIFAAEMDSAKVACRRFFVYFNRCSAMVNTTNMAVILTTWGLANMSSAGRKTNNFIFSHSYMIVTVAAQVKWKKYPLRSNFSVDKICIQRIRIACVRLHVDGRMCFNANLIFSSLLSSFSLQWKMKNGNLGGRPDCCRCSRHHEPISNGPGEYILCRCVTNFEGLIFDLHRKMINDCSVTNSSGTDMDHNEWISLAAQLHTIKWLTWSSCANCWINCARKYAAERDPFKHIPCRDYALIWSRNIYDDLFGMPAITSQPNKHAIHANWLLIFPYKGDCGRC